MPGFTKDYRGPRRPHSSPASRYDDPRGGRASALERNILRYRTVEVTLYLFYADRVTDFMMSNVYPRAKKAPDAPLWEPLEEQRLTNLLSRVLLDAETRKLVSIEDAEGLQQALASEYSRGRQMKLAFGYAIKIGMFSQAEANELQTLMSYRNDIAHRIHHVMSDVTRTSWNTDSLSFKAPVYKAEALDRLRRYNKTLEQRADGKLITYLSMDRIVFELAEQVYENELERLDATIRKLVEVETQRSRAIKAEMDLRGTELVGDLAPAFPPNRRPSRICGDDYIPTTGHLTPRGGEICYRLFDLGKSPIAVAYLMRITLRSAERRRKGWLHAGGLDRTRAEVRRYDLDNGRSIARGA